MPAEGFEINVIVGLRWPSIRRSNDVVDLPRTGNSIVSESGIEHAKHYQPRNWRRKSLQRRSFRRGPPKLGQLMTPCMKILVSDVNQNLWPSFEEPHAMRPSVTRSTPQVVKSLSGVQSVSLGSRFSIAVTSTGAVFAWCAHCARTYQYTDAKQQHVQGPRIGPSARLRVKYEPQSEASAGGPGDAPC